MRISRVEDTRGLDAILGSGGSILLPNDLKTSGKEDANFRLGVLSATHSVAQTVRQVPRSEPHNAAETSHPPAGYRPAWAEWLLLGRGQPVITTCRQPKIPGHLPLSRLQL